MNMTLCCVVGTQVNTCTQKQQVPPPKHIYLSTKLHGAVSLTVSSKATSLEPQIPSSLLKHDLKSYIYLENKMYNVCI